VRRGNGIILRRVTVSDGVLVLVVVKGSLL